MSLPYSDNFVVLPATQATVANTAAKIFDVSKRQLKSIQFTASTISGDNGAFGVEVSDDGSNWIVYNRLISNLTNTNAQTDTRVAAPTLSSNTSQIYFFPTSDYFRYIRVFVTASASAGTYTATMQCAG